MNPCAVPLLSALLASCNPVTPLATGYVEGDHVLIAPVSVAEVKNLQVARGQKVVAGQELARQDDRDAKITVEQAQAALDRAQSQLDNLRLGRRSEEIRVIEAALASARAQLTEARRTAERLATLAERGAATQTQREDAQTTLSMAEAKVAETEANLAVANLPARPAEIAAAEAAVQAGRADLEKAQWVLEKRILTAPASGVISDVLRRPGEIAGPTSPIVSLLPEGAVKLRLYVPETEIARLGTGSLLAVSCDGCPKDLAAKVSYIADGPEFTPPVIYSLQNRQKLVYLVEALPETDAGLKPGQIVDVALPEARE